MKVTWPWEDLEPIMWALRKRGYSHRIDKHGLTVEWDDPELTEERLRAGIAQWVAEDKRAKALQKHERRRKR